MIRFSTVIALLTTAALVAGAQPVTSARSVTPAYVAVGDSYEFGIGDDIAADGIGYVPILSAFLTGFYGQPVDTTNLGVPGATAREILLTQVSEAIAAAQGGAPVVVSWGGGAAITQTIARLRLSLGPDAIILMLTHPNTARRTGCATVEQIALADAALEGAPGTVLSRGLNDRIRDIAATYGAEVVDIRVRAHRKSRGRGVPGGAVGVNASDARATGS